MSPNLLVLIGLVPANSSEDFLRLTGLGSGDVCSKSEYNDTIVRQYIYWEKDDSRKIYLRVVAFINLPLLIVYSFWPIAYGRKPAEAAAMIVLGGAPCKSCWCSYCF